jgi:hypothetical protein
VAPPRPTQYALDALLDSSKEACHTRLRTVAKLSDDDEKAVAIQSLSNAQLIQILLLDDSDEDELNSITRMVETEIARRKKEGGEPMMARACQRRYPDSLSSTCSRREGA